MMLRSDSVEATHAIAAAVASLARVGDIIVLAGEMGAGKTAFAQGFGRALGVTETITSPTFTLVHSYPCEARRVTLHHADLYRLDSTADVDDLALSELAEFDGIVIVEWGDVAASTLGDHLEVRLLLDDDDDHDRDDDDRDDDARDEDGPGEPVRSDPPQSAGATGSGTDADDDFGLLSGRTIELHATGGAWAGRWDRLVASVEGYRC